MWLIALGDAQVQSGLGLTSEDIAVLRGGMPGKPAAQPYHPAFDIVELVAAEGV